MAEWEGVVGVVVGVFEGGGLGLSFFFFSSSGISRGCWLVEFFFGVLVVRDVLYLFFMVF